MSLHVLLDVQVGEQLLNLDRHSFRCQLNSLLQHRLVDLFDEFRIFPPKQNSSPPGLDLYHFPQIIVLYVVQQRNDEVATEFLDS